jgi:serine/threonine protein kinase
MMVTGFGCDDNNVVGEMIGYIEPQCLRNSAYRRDKASDVYSLGVLLWEISSGIPPFNNMEIMDIAREVFQGKREITIEGSPPGYVTIYQMAWNDDPTKRPTISMIRDDLERSLYPPSYNNSMNSISFYIFIRFVNSFIINSF